MVCFFLSLLKRKLPQRCPKRGGGGEGHFWTISKRKQLFFLGLLPQVSWGFRYTSWLLVALPKVRFRNTALTILIHLSLAPTSLQLFLIPTRSRTCQWGTLTLVCPIWRRPSLCAFPPLCLPLWGRSCCRRCGTGKLLPLAQGAYRVWYFCHLPITRSIWGIVALFGWSLIK